jgi:16S rRNA (cytosine967-C5)-methyltransferase
MTGRDRSTDLLNRRLRDYPPDSRDRGLLSELVMGVLRRRLALAAVLAPQLRRPLESTDAVLRELLLVLAYQALFLGRIPPHARVAATVAAARSRAGEPAARFVNAIGRGLERRLAAGDVLADLDAPTLWSVPGPVLAQARAADGAAWDDGCLPAFAAHAPSVLRVNRAAMSRDDARARPGACCPRTRPPSWSSTPWTRAPARRSWTCAPGPE